MIKFLLITNLNEKTNKKKSNYIEKSRYEKIYDRKFYVENIISKSNLVLNSTKNDDLIKSL